MTDHNRFSESIHVTGFNHDADNISLRIEVSPDRNYLNVYDEDGNHLFGITADEMNDLIDRVQVIWPEYPNITI